jgi:hypothetical protein
MQFLAAEDRSFHAWALLSPFLLLALPAVAITAAMAVLFETLRFLRGGFGNVLWFFLWSFGIALPGLAERPQLDPSGLWMVYASMRPAARAGIPGYTDGFSLTLADKSVRIAAGFHWNGIAWTTEVVIVRLAWLVAALALVLCSAWFFDRFDPARSRRRVGVGPSPEGAAAQPEAAAPPVTPWPRSPMLVSLTPLASEGTTLSTLRLVVAELRLALKGYRWWWYAVAGGLAVAQLASPLEVSRGPLLAAAWIWPILVWSALGTREARFRTEQLLFSCPRILRRQLPAAWLAGLLVAVFTGLGSAVRLALAGQGSGLAAWFAGVVFVPSLALALGVWSSASKFFEGMYTALWYVGPLERVRGFDFTGSANGPLAFRFALIYLAMAAVLVAAAFLRRAWQVRVGSSSGLH